MGKVQKIVRVRQKAPVKMTEYKRGINYISRNIN